MKSYRSTSENNKSQLPWEPQKAFHNTAIVSTCQSYSPPRVLQLHWLTKVTLLYVTVGRWLNESSAIAIWLESGNCTLILDWIYTCQKLVLHKTISFLLMRSLFTM